MTGARWFTLRPEGLGATKALAALLAPVRFPATDLGAPLGEATRALAKALFPCATLRLSPQDGSVAVSGLPDRAAFRLVPVRVADPHSP